MLEIQLNNKSESETLFAPEQEDAPFSVEIVTMTRQELIELKADKNRYQSLYQRTLEKNKELEAQLKLERAKVRDLTHRLYGKKTEKSAIKSEKSPTRNDFVGPPKPPAKRGAKPERPNRPRRKNPDLPIKEEIISICDEQLCCPECGEAYVPFPKTEDSEIIEIHIAAHVRKIKREQAKAGCQCPNRPALITAPTAPRVYPKARYGVSVWVLVLLDKFQSYTPSNRLYQRLDDQGVSLAAGTVTNGLNKISPLFAPIQQAMQEQQAQETLFHNDETTWKVFEAVEGKVGYKWYLWVTRSASVISLTVATGRSTQVIEDNFSDHGKDPIIIVCDRYAAYKKFAREHADFVVLAFCWAHVRRDFLDAARSYPDDEAWMFQWVEAIGELYHLNQQRIEHWDMAKPLDQQSDLFKQYHQALLTVIETFRLRITAALETEAPLKGEPETKRFKLATSLDNHWEGLTRFVENPLIPMDNNPAEQALRMPVAGRRSFYGSGSIWSAEFAVLMMGWIKTLQMWELNPHAWLTTYLQACAENRSAPPDDISSFLPWNMDEERMEYFQKPEVSRMG
jgi:transposase